MIKPPSPTMLGRWRVASCEEVKTIYIKRPTKAENYINKK